MLKTFKKLKTIVADMKIIEIALLENSSSEPEPERESPFEKFLSNMTIEEYLGINAKYGTCEWLPDSRQSIPPDSLESIKKEFELREGMENADN